MQKAKNTMVERLFIGLQHIVPHHVLSRMAGRLAASEQGWVKDRLIRRFMRAYRINLAEAEQADGNYPSFNAFFTRALKPGARPLAPADRFILSPADGTISQLGRIAAGRIIQAKGHDYSVTELLGGDAEQARRFHNGSFATIYLAPSDYHRVHMAADGSLAHTTYLPGALFSVNPVTAAAVPRLFARNERLACMFTGDVGHFAQVLVGAMIVAGMETVWAGPVKPHGKRILKRDFTPAKTQTKTQARTEPETQPASGGAQAPQLRAGDEMGRFLLGSTVVLLFEQDKVSWLPELGPGSRLLMGQAMANRSV
ncbi:archaetidylserine decarboxylase [Croceicoccus sp. F390]|uniref:Phosphatidylserine decarboxylase proenzyme n=1 Tax=Croceicoccus esteveae TaxID=3075597 RepID=A0ABU2ZJG8_9SPHN|nr:archaetidylserine decarboxylase [Croceicoccus sp. F390]MDT0576762.1 archaetidylserine decarboxylase [Croceicoccus sp. F390]